MELEILGAAGEVTGSCYLLRCNGQTVLLECGLVQGRPRDEARNRDPFPFDVGSIDAVVLSHAHLDHSGRLPLLVERGYRGPIHAHPATRDLCRIMLRDAAYLNEKDAQWDNRKRARKGLPARPPLYTQRTARRTERLFRDLEYGPEREIVPGVWLRFHDAGHILGSCIVELRAREAGAERTLVFSGDLGHRGAPILRDPARLAHADLVMLESTYGDRSHRPWGETWQELGGVLAEAGRANGVVLIPAFAVGRTQELLYTFGRRFAEWNLGSWTIALDSPLAQEATEVYARHAGDYDAEAARVRAERGDPFDLPNLYMSRTPVQSRSLNRLRGGAIIIAGSGMCDGGRMRHHLKHRAWRRETHLVFVGFQASGTTGRALVDGARFIRLWGETIRVAAQVHTIGGLSAHADQEGLAGWYSGFANRPPVVLVHGEPEQRAALAERLRRDFGVTAHQPEHGARIDLLHPGAAHAPVRHADARN